MTTPSVTDDEFIKLSHFDRVRCGYFDKIPFNFALIGLALSLNIFNITDQITFLIASMGMFWLGVLLKNELVGQDVIERKKYAKDINKEYQNRMLAQKQKNTLK